MFGVIGQLLLSGIGGYLFDNYGPSTPFMFVGACDFAFFVITVTLICLGYWEDEGFKERQY